MNLLSLLSAMLFAGFLIGGIYCFTRNRKSSLNVFSFLVLVLLGWWSFCNAFFFSAATETEAMLWHRLASIGWTGFIAATTYYFIILTNRDRRMKNLWAQTAFYALPTVLLAHNLFSDTTSLALGVVKSGVGGQWAYVNSLANPWLWAYLLCLCLYFGGSFYLLLHWAASVRHRLKRHMAVSFVVLDALTILLGFITDVLSPLTGSALPAVANLCTAVFAGGYFLVIVRYDLFNVRRVVEDRDIIEHSMEPLLVVDETGEILDINLAGVRLMGKERDELVGKLLPSFFEKEEFVSRILSPLESDDVVTNVEISLVTPKNEKKQLMVSGSVIRDRKNEYMGTVLSVRDITQLTQLREQYRKLAYMDTLTGLPNRRSTFDYLKNLETQYDETERDFFILYMDIDDFKSVNDRYGHNQGDRFLKTVSERLEGCLTGSLKFLGRLSGDEFLMAGFPVCDDNALNDLSAAVKRQLDTSFVIDGVSIDCGISVGCAKYSDFGNIDTMIQYADQKMYRIKKRGKSTVRHREGR